MAGQAIPGIAAKSLRLWCQLVERTRTQKRKIYLTRGLLKIIPTLYYLSLQKEITSLRMIPTVVGRESEAHPAFSFQYGVCRRAKEVFGSDILGTRHPQRG